MTSRPVPAGAQAAQPSYCPSCAGALRPGAVLCVHCGMDLREGQRRSVSVGEQEPVESRREPRLGRTGRAVALAGMTGLGLAVIWTAVVVMTGWSLGYLAIAIGALVGLVMADQLRRGGWAWGGVAAGITLASLLLAKVLIVGVGQIAVAQRDVAENPQLLQAAMILSLGQQRAFSAEVQAMLDARAAGEGPPPVEPGQLTLDERVAMEAQQRLAELSPSERQAIARELIDSTSTASLASSGSGVVFSQRDALWMVIGVAAAAGVADGVGRWRSART